jgi:hypothetical protein
VKHIASIVGGIVYGLPWIAGIVLASGFWSATAAIFLPPYAWYLVVERGMKMAGWL